nr:cytochrome b/b6 domain-containing protein [uncultured Glaciecola sp.]
MQKLYIWDFPTRLFHWLLVIAIASQYVTAELIDDAIQWHFYGGYFILGLLIFRLIWGIWGAYYAKFSQFIVSPQRAIQYSTTFTKSNYKPILGHNPLGAYSIIFILTVLLTQAISGLFITDDIFHSGPYYNAIGDDTRDIMNWLHNQGFKAVWLFLSLHIGAMIVYKFAKKQNLVVSMITGYKSHKNQIRAIQAQNHWLKFAVFACLSAIIVYLIVVTFAPEVVDDFYY